jgi:hypothetical protein
VRVHDAYATPALRAAESAFEPRRRFTEKDAVLITYDDLVVSEGRTLLATLSDFAFVFFRGFVTTGRSTGPPTPPERPGAALPELGIACPGEPRGAVTGWMHSGGLRCPVR